MRPQVALNTSCAHRVDRQAVSKEAICLLRLLVRGSHTSGHVMGIRVQVNLLWCPQGGSVVSKVVGASKMKASPNLVLQSLNYETFVSKQTG